MTMRDRIRAALRDAMLTRNETRIATLRLMLAALKDREIAARAEEGDPGLTERDAIALFARMLRQREDSIRSYEQAGRMELAEEEREEMEVIREFLPAPMTEAETEAAIRAAIDETGARSIRDMGRVMAALKARHAGRMDFSKVGAAVKAALE